MDAATVVVAVSVLVAMVVELAAMIVTVTVLVVAGPVGLVACRLQADVMMAPGYLVRPAGVLRARFCWPAVTVTVTPTTSVRVTTGVV